LTEHAAAEATGGRVYAAGPIAAERVRNVVWIRVLQVLGEAGRRSAVVLNLGERLLSAPRDSTATSKLGDTRPSPSILSSIPIHHDTQFGLSDFSLGPFAVS